VSAGSDLWPGRVRAAFTGAFGDAVTVDEGFGPLTVDVPAEHWVAALRLVRDGLDCAFFDFLTAVDELGGDPDGFRVVCHVADHHSPGPGGVLHLVVRTLLPRDAATLPSVATVYAGARWHERETHEMFGVDFTDDGGEVLDLDKLLLPEQFEGHPLRKEFVLASRVAKPWPGAKEPGESDHDTSQPGRAAPATRRRVKPPGVPDDWRHAPGDGDADE
jgi:NADH-quinone oxidoreductase subunit C